MKTVHIREWQGYPWVGSNEGLHAFLRGLTGKAPNTELEKEKEREKENTMKQMLVELYHHCLKDGIYFINNYYKYT